MVSDSSTEEAAAETTLVQAIRDPETLDVEDLTADELASERARLLPFATAIEDAAKLVKAKKFAVEKAYEDGHIEINRLSGELKKAEAAFQPTHIAGRLHTIMARMGG